MTDSEIVPTLNTIIGEVEFLRKRNDRQVKMIESLQEQNRNQMNTLDAYNKRIQELTARADATGWREAYTKLKNELDAADKQVKELQTQIAQLKNLDSTIGLLRGQLLSSRQLVDELQKQIAQLKNPKPEYMWVLRAHQHGSAVHETHTSKTPFTAEVILDWQKKDYGCMITYEAAF